MQPPATASAAHRNAAHAVLTAPELFEWIVGFQLGLPAPLHAFWVEHLAHPPGAGASTMEATDHVDRRRLPLFVVHKGDLRLLQLVPHASWFNGVVRMVTPQQMELPLLKAIELARLDMVEWMIEWGVRPVACGETSLWQAACEHFDGDFRILELLRGHFGGCLQPSENRERSVLQRLAQVNSLEGVEMPLLEAGEKVPLEAPAAEVRFSESVKHVTVVRWLEAAGAHVASTPEMLKAAATRGDLEFARYLMEERGLPGTPDAMCVAWKRFHYDLFFYLQENSTVAHSLAMQQWVVRIGDFAVLELLHRRSGLHAIAVGFTAPMDAAARDGHLEVVKLLHTYAAASCSTAAMNDAAARGHLDVVQFLHANCTEGCTTDAMDLAAENGWLQVVRFLHEHRTEGCTTRALDGAAKAGKLELVKFLHEHRGEGATTAALDEAAANGHYEIVWFLHEHRREGCTTIAMNYAAAHGHFSVVRFLHEQRREGCTTRAMDQAASRGFLDVTTYLYVNRREGCMRSGVADAIRNKHVDVVRFLYVHYPQYFDGSATMHELLLAGVFDLWSALRDARPDTDDAAAAAMLDAGKHYKLNTIRFLYETVGRGDLLPLAMDGAAARQCVGWVLTLHAMYPTCCHLSAVKKLIDSAKIQSNVAFATTGKQLLSLMMRLCVQGSRDDAIAYATEQLAPNQSRLEDVLLALEEPITMSPQDEDTDHRKEALKDVASASGGPVLGPAAALSTLAVRAINTGRTYALPSILLGGQSQQSLPNEEDDQTDARLSFTAARAVAISLGQLDTLQWLLEHSPEPVEPTLLDVAIFYRKPRIAAWLAETHPSACRAFGCTKASSRFPFSVGVTRDTIAWLEGSETLRWTVDFGAMAAYAADRGDLELVRQLFEKYPTACMVRTDILDRAAASGELSLVLYIEATGYEHCSTDAMDNAVRDTCLDVVRYLHVNRREGCTARAMTAAATLGQLRMVQFHALHRSEGIIDDAIEGSKRGGVWAVPRFLMMLKYGRASNAELHFRA